MIEVIDNFCDEKYFEKIQELMIKPSPDFPWFYQDAVNGGAYDGEKDVFQFVHTFYPGVPKRAPWMKGNPVVIQEDPSMSSLMPVIEALGVQNLLRVKANCVPRTEKIIEHGLHVDFVEKGNEILTTSILYMNTNNGYTHFEDGTKIESVANRLVTFPCNILHGGSSCTDQNTRVVINFNFLKA